MAGKTIGGISGVLGELISSAPISTEARTHRHTSSASREPEPTGTPRATSPCPGRARLGRPPGRNKCHSGSKEKVTIRIPTDLIADYRDWSWEARCQLSELVERALVNYRESMKKASLKAK